MNNQQILDNAPEGATHIDNDGEYAKEDGYGLEYFRVTWHKYTEPVELRLLVDIKRIAELEKDMAFLQSCVNSGETATKADRPSSRAKTIKEQGK